MTRLDNIEINIYLLFVSIPITPPPLICLGNRRPLGKGRHHAQQTPGIGLAGDSPVIIVTGDCRFIQDICLVYTGGSGGPGAGSQALCNIYEHMLAYTWCIHS